MMNTGIFLFFSQKIQILITLSVGTWRASVTITVKTLLGFMSLFADCRERETRGFCAVLQLFEEMDSST